MSDRFDEMARECCKEIIDDLSDRRGLRQEWESIDDGVQREIRDLWSGFIAALVRRAVDDAYLDCADLARQRGSDLLRDPAFTLPREAAVIRRHTDSLFALIVARTTAIRARGSKEGR